MAISYNASKTNCSHIYRATGGGVTFSANLVGTAFDYFTDTAVANDAIYFAWNYTTGFSDLYLNVATAMAGTGIVVIWEYPDTMSTWRPIHNLTDGSNGLTTTGAVTVQFPLQANHIYPTVNGIARSWIRCRLVSLTTITEGGANTSTTPQVANGSVDITGYTDASPCYWNTVYSWLVTNAPQTLPERLASDVYKFSNVKFNITSTLRSSHETIFIGNGSYGLTLVLNGLWSGNKVGTDGWSGGTEYYICSKSSSNILNSSATTRIYGGSFKGFTNIVDGLTCAPSGNYHGITAGEWIGVYCEQSGYFNNATCNKCTVDGSLITASAVPNYPTNMTIADPKSYIWGIYAQPVTITGVKYSAPSSAIFGFNQYGAEPNAFNLVNPSPAIPSTQLSTPKVVYRQKPAALSITKCFLYDASAGTYTDYTTEINNATADNVPLGSDDGDCLYILGGGLQTYNQPKYLFTITGNTNVAEHVTELCTGSGTWTSRKVWDGTDNYQKSGDVYVAVPVGYAAVTVNGVSGLWMRIRTIGNETTPPKITRAFNSYQTGIGEWKVNEFFTVTGHTIDENGDPIEGASVVIKDNEDTEYSLTTDANGLTVATNVKTKYAYFDPIDNADTEGCKVKALGPFSITISKSGYETYKETGEITGELTKTVVLKTQITKLEDDNGNVFDRVDKTNSGTTNLRRKIVKI